MTLREVIASSGIIPQNRKYSWIIYNNYDNYIINETLKRVGIEKKDITNTIGKKAYTSIKQKVGLENLIEIISKFMVNHEGKVQYGYKSPIQTNFYISTVEASYDTHYLNWMCLLLGDLVLDAFNKQIIPQMPDFILTPKGGNTHLGRIFADNKGILFVTSKYSVNSTYVTFLKDDFEYNLRTNYEGSWALLERQKAENSGKLFGIIIDCNTTTGEQIIDTMKDFNHLVSSLQLNIASLTTAFTLFRPVDNEACNIDQKFEQNGYRLCRYFDLSESNKEAIIRGKGKKEKLCVYINSELSIIRKILQEIEVQSI